jgi:hypothetical protein
MRVCNWTARGSQGTTGRSTPRSAASTNARASRGSIACRWTLESRPTRERARVAGRASALPHAATVGCLLLLRVPWTPSPRTGRAAFALARRIGFFQAAPGSGLALSPDDSSAAAGSEGPQAWSCTAARVAERGRAFRVPVATLRPAAGWPAAYTRHPLELQRRAPGPIQIQPTLDPGPALTDRTARADQRATSRHGELRLINQLLRHDDAATHLDHAGALKLLSGVAVVAPPAVPEGVRDVAFPTCTARRKSLAEDDAAILRDLGSATRSSPRRRVDGTGAGPQPRPGADPARGARPLAPDPRGGDSDAGPRRGRATRRAHWPASWGRARADRRGCVQDRLLGESLQRARAPLPVPRAATGQPALAPAPLRPGRLPRRRPGLSAQPDRERDPARQPAAAV